MKVSHKSGFSTFQLIIVLIAGYYAWTYIENNYIYKDTPKYVVQFKDAIKDFTEQKDTVRTSYNEAIDAQSEAKKVQYSFKHEKTKLFISKWKDTENEITVLKEKFEVYEDKTELFIDQLDDNLDRIKNDEKLKDRIKEFSQKKARIMGSNIKKIRKNIAQLDVSIQKGNNLIIALETISSFNLLAEDIKSFDKLLNNSSKIFTDIDKLVDEGLTVLNDELDTK
jgi:hypothetical protein